MRASPSGPGRPTSTPLPSASRSTIPVTSSATRSFPEAQLAALEALCRDIIVRHRIRPERVLAHSDVAPTRKKDPGEKFPWARLARAGIGHWVSPEPVRRPILAWARRAPDRWWPTCRAAAQYGYGMEPTGGFDAQTEFVVTAFQRHFRPERVDGRIDQSTITTLERLVAALPHGALRLMSVSQEITAAPLRAADRLDVRAVLVLVACCACWGVNRSAIKIANAGISPILQVGLRSLLSGLLVLAWSARARHSAVRARPHVLAGRHLQG